MRTGIPEALRRIAELDERIDALQEELAECTRPLERAAMAFYEANPREGKRSCARCRFVFREAWQQQPGMVAFDTDCSWCGVTTGGGLRVSVARLTPFLA